MPCQLLQWEVISSGAFLRHILCGDVHVWFQQECWERTVHQEWVVCVVKSVYIAILMLAICCAACPPAESSFSFLLRTLSSLLSQILDSSESYVLASWNLLCLFYKDCNRPVTTRTLFQQLSWSITSSQGCWFSDCAHCASRLLQMRNMLQKIGASSYYDKDWFYVVIYSDH